MRVGTGAAWVCVYLQEAGSFSDLQQQVDMQAATLKNLAGSNRKLAVDADSAAAGGGAAASVLARLASVEAWSFDVRAMHSYILSQKNRAEDHMPRRPAAPPACSV